jgi:lipopolysaccharide export system permease protein
MIGLRFLLGLFSARVLVALLGAVALLAIADLAETSRQLADQPDRLRLVLTVYGNLAPSLALQALPVALLLGVLLAVTDLARSGELVALRAAGAGPLRLILPALLLAGALCGAGILIADHVAPPGVARATQIQMESLGRMRSAWSPFHGERRWFAAEGGGLYHVAEVGDGGRILSEVTRYDHDDGRFTGLSKSARLVHDGDGWRAEDPRSWTFVPEDGEVLRLAPAFPQNIEAPAHFAGVAAHPEALPRRALAEATALRRAQGQPTLPFELEAQARWTFPLLGLGLTLLALGLALTVRLPATHVEAAAQAIGIAFVAWTVLALCRALGLAGMVAPAVAALLPVILPAGLGVALLVWRR